MNFSDFKLKIQFIGGPKDGDFISLGYCNIPNVINADGWIYRLEEDLVPENWEYFAYHKQRYVVAGFLKNTNHHEQQNQTEKDQTTGNGTKS